MTSVLIIDDEKTFCEVLSGALSTKGFDTRYALNAKDAIIAAKNFDPEYVVLDLKIQHESGLLLIPELLAIDAYTHIVVLTGYASIATAVEAIKLGAMHYLAKPVNVEEIIDAFSKTTGNPNVPVGSEPLTVIEVEWDHIRSVLKRNQGNISATARELRMHRRTLQRKLDKMPSA